MLRWPPLGDGLQPSLRTAFSLYAFGVLGLLLLFLPWSAAWTQSVHALASREYVDWLLSGWIRGVVSGLGSLDLLIATQLAIELWRGMRRRVVPRSIVERE